MNSAAARAGAVLTIDLDAIVANWRQLGRRVAPAECAAVVKADAYGLGAAPVAAALVGAGCRTFFVACIDEAIALRPVVGDADIYVLAGAPRGAEADCVHHRLSPVLNGLADIEAWRAFMRTTGGAAPRPGLHLDTAMSRLGLSAAEQLLLAAEPDRLAGIRLGCVMSHLACADEADHPTNTLQREAFARIRQAWQGTPTSFANSAGIFLGAPFHGDMCRPGAALYGLAPVADRPNPMAQVVQLQGRILQVREIDRGMTVGYGSTYHAGRRKRIVTVAVGYADGYLRSLGNRGHALIGDFRIPLVGRVSMDLITFDATAVPEALVRPGVMVELIGPRLSVDAVAADAGTIGYEILTSLGKRYHRIYLGASGEAGPDPAGS